MYWFDIVLCVDILVVDFMFVNVYCDGSGVLCDEVCVFVLYCWVVEYELFEVV